MGGAKQFWSIWVYGERVVACSVTCTFALRMHAEEDNEEGGR